VHIPHISPTTLHYILAVIDEEVGDPYKAGLPPVVHDGADADSLVITALRKVTVWLISKLLIPSTNIAFY
jgi:hypothetical protein